MASLPCGPSSAIASPTDKRRLWLLTSFILLGAALRTPLLRDYRLHGDEALFAALARHILQNGDLLLLNTGLLVDKPPLLYYTIALGKSFDWASAWTARLPGLWASLITIALVARLSQRLFQRWQAAAVLTVLNPFSLAFAPTAFADPLMLMWWVASLVALVERRAGWAGLLWGLAFATKQNALFLLPLVVLLAPERRTLLHFTLGAGGVMALIVGWDVLRPDASFWAAGIAANNPRHLIHLRDLLPRLTEMALFVRIAAGGWLVGLALVVLLVTRRAAPPAARIAVFGVGYLLLHLIVAFPLFDRYFLPLSVLFALLWGSVALSWRHVIVLCALLLPATVGTFANMHPVGGDRGAHDGIEAIAAHLDAAPPGTVLYFRDVGWQLSFYLFDHPVYLASLTSPDLFADDLRTATDRADRYLLLPARIPAGGYLEAAQQAGYTPHLVQRTVNRFGDVSFVLYYLGTDANP